MIAFLLLYQHVILLERQPTQMEAHESFQVVRRVMQVTNIQIHCFLCYRLRNIFLKSCLQLFFQIILYCRLRNLFVRIRLRYKASN